MPKKDPRVDAYIRKAKPFAQPILTHLRKVVHSAVPDVEETMKWSTPHFDYKGMFCGIAAFKEHVGFGFWKAALLEKHLPGPGGLSAAGPRPELKAPAGQRREYIAWVIEAKQAATRAKRIETAVEWMAEGKIRNWKYVK